MSQDAFDRIDDPTRRREAQLFTNAVLLGANMSAVILHALVVRDVLTKEAAASLIEDAFAKGRALSYPPGFERIPQMVAQALKAGFA